MTIIESIHAYRAQSQTDCVPRQVQQVCESVASVLERKRSELEALYDAMSDDPRCDVAHMRALRRIIGDRE